jgi:hypothetical protein
MPLRKEPSHRAEQVSQLLFGEKAEVLTIEGDNWALIRAKFDEYEGWCKFSQLEIISKKSFQKEIKYISTRHTGKLVVGDSEIWIPAASEWTQRHICTEMGEGFFKGKKTKWGELRFEKEALYKAATQFLRTPYQWGGRSVAGMDCSGFSQVVYKLCGKQIRRDASQQASEGMTLDFLQNARIGDLAFFDNQEGRINHVGILLDPQTIIHATDTSGCVVVDKIDPSGIISNKLKKRTHNLRLIKRYFEPEEL